MPGGNRRRLARRALRRHWLPTPYRGALRYLDASHFPHPAVRRRAAGAAGSLRLLERPRAYVHLPTASLQLVYDMRMELPRDLRGVSLFHVDERLESGLVAASTAAARTSICCR
jgi:hypothetical protein